MRSHIKSKHEDGFVTVTDISNQDLPVLKPMLEPSVVKLVKTKELESRTKSENFIEPVKVKTTVISVND